MDTIKSYFSTENRGKTITIILVLILLMLIGYFFFGKKVFAPSQKDIKLNSITTEDSSNNSENLIEVENQNPGDVINITNLSLNKPSWIAIYSDNEGEPGNILGAQFLKAGEYTNTPVQIFVRTVAGDTYYAVIQTEDGVPSFDYKTDLPITDNDGKWIMDSFEVLSTGARG